MSEKDRLLLIRKYLLQYSENEKFPNENPIFGGEVSIGNTIYNVIGVFFEKNPNLLANTILEKYKCEIVFLIDIKQGIVLLRKNKNCSIDLSKLAKHLSKGGGNKDIAGCLLNDNIINITKFLKPINEE